MKKTCTHYFFVNLETGLSERRKFQSEHYDEARDYSIRNEGIQLHLAIDLINRWNNKVTSYDPRCRFVLDVNDERVTELEQQVEHQRANWRSSSQEAIALRKELSTVRETLKHEQVLSARRAIERASLQRDYVRAVDDHERTKIELKNSDEAIRQLQERLAQAKSDRDELAGAVDRVKHEADIRVSRAEYAEKSARELHAQSQGRALKLEQELKNADEAIGQLTIQRDDALLAVENRERELGRDTRRTATEVTASGLMADNYRQREEIRMLKHTLDRVQRLADDYEKRKLPDARLVIARQKDEMEALRLKVRTFEESCRRHVEIEAELAKERDNLVAMNRAQSEMLRGEGKIAELGQQLSDTKAREKELWRRLQGARSALNGDGPEVNKGHE